MEKFIGREKELRELEIRFSSDAFEFIVIYGRRRVGKTMLIEQSINNRRCILNFPRKDTQYLEHP